MVGKKRVVNIRVEKVTAKFVVETKLKKLIKDTVDKLLEETLLGDKHEIGKQNRTVE